MASATKPSGVILWEGKSRITGAPIVAIATDETSNEKTGDMVQVWILDATMLPTEASRTGADESICGGCPARGNAQPDKKGEWHATGRWCYVNLAFAPEGIWKTWKRGGYPKATPALLRALVRGRPIRLGAYGDLTAVPKRVWTRLLKYGKGHTGYTHSWDKPFARGYRSLVMASVQSEAGARKAKAAGWRYFRVRRHDDPIMKGEITCPAAPEGQYRADCAKCKACDGWKREGQVSITIIGHGPGPIMHNLRRALDKAALVN